ncbi:hypothetical protein [Pararhizobium qamdonense]|uniref:hypothetical protein n=1 Tax=Pararhizobium qamdonense TaxID=3031126 RepID=UPI0023E209E7|nr:hypothetical protein [Pararhizobium qamdonense]
MARKKAPVYRTTRDIVIPAGSVVGRAPHRTEYGTPHGDIVVGFDKNAIGDMRFDIEDALNAGVIEVVK